MKALLIVAHGSRQREANRFLESLSAEIAAEADGKFDMVESAFLQFNGPYAIDIIADLIEKGADHIVVFPYFLSEGRHVLTDIPNLIQEAQVQYPGVVIEARPMLGEIRGLKDLILDVV
ncbi:CbiX/SirB N-terminal domain-containing protein [bacterium]|nr:CbiX/SirB N-terminal domain-containing protein [bacterium]